MAMAAIVHEARKLRQGGLAQEGLDILENDINVRARGRRGMGREGDGRRCGLEKGEEHIFCERGTRFFEGMMRMPTSLHPLDRR